MTPTPSATPPSPASISYITQSSNTANQTNYTFSSVATGVGLVVVNIASGNASFGNNLSSVTIGGVNATITQNLKFAGAGGNAYYNAVAYAVTTASTNNIVVNWSSGMLNCGIGVWTITNYQSTTPEYTSGYTTTATTTMALTTSSLTAGSVGVATHTFADDNFTASWTGAAKDYQVTIEGTPMAGGDFTSAGGGTITITMTSDNTPVTYGRGMALVTWR
jgi:hypothetical protein